MTWPNFFIIGAPKSGTTSLFNYLGQHPDIYMCPQKEPAYFVFEGDRPDVDRWDPQSVRNFYRLSSSSTVDIEDYLDLFRDVKAEKAIGEASVRYLYQPKVAEKIRRQIPNAKLIAMLRNPFDAAYASFLMSKRSRRIKYKDFFQAIQKEDVEDPDPWSTPSYIRRRFYDIHLERYFRLFSKVQMRIFLFEDLNDIQRLLGCIFRFLSVDDHFVPDTSVRYNVEAATANLSMLRPLLEYVPITARDNLKFVLPPPVFSWYMKRKVGMSKEIHTPTKCPPEAKAFLRPIYEPHILRLQKIIERDLSSWLR